jgi:5S rRNA maturation endonuclease (ribonuclease M5)
MNNTGSGPILPKPKPKIVIPETDLSEWVVSVFKKRKISIDVLKRNKVKDNGKEIMFVYHREGKPVNVKYRSRDKKYRQESGGQKIFYGLDDIKDQKEVIIVEGEADKLACEEASFKNVLSVPDGAPDVNTKNYVSKFSYIENCEAELEHVDKFIIAVDNDAAGKKLETELIRRLGPEKCYTVQWPEGCKDANQVLMEKEEYDLVLAIEEAKPVPISGIFEMHDFENELDKLYHNNGRESGLSTGWYSVDELYTVRPGEVTVVTGIPSHGKALSIYEYIPYEKGWLVMGDVRVGDKVFDENGKLCNVIATTETMHNRPCYKITFDDDSEITCDANHEWLTNNEKARRSAVQQKAEGKRNGRIKTLPKGTDQQHKRTFPSIVTTEYISKTLKSQGKNNHQVTLCKPVRYSSKKLKIDPYVLGAWLGDGNSRDAGITTADWEIIGFIQSKGYKTSLWRSGKYSYGILGLQSKLRELDLLKNKHIPRKYLRGSVCQRFELLKGLMDTDGSCSKLDRRCEFVNMNKTLAYQVLELVLSLGIKATMTTGKAMLKGKDHGIKYRVCFNTETPVFHLKRKRDRQIHTGSRKAKSYARTIISCQRVPSVPVKCIQVDSPSKLYLATKNFIPTHNSEVVDAIMTNLAINHDWRFATFSPENHPIELHASKIIQKYIGKPFSKSYPGYMNPVEFEGCKPWLEEHFKFIAPKDDELRVDNIIEKAIVCVKRYGIKGLSCDPWNEFDHSRPAGLTETEYISLALTRVRRFARQYGVHVWIIAHPTKLSKNIDGNYPVPTPYDINGSANWRNKADNCLSIWRDLQDESKEVQFHVQKIRFREIGKVGMAGLKYTINSGRYCDA